MLAGVRVVSVCQYLAGPMCTRLLGDLGADVIKVENIDRGDQYRYMKHDYDTGMPADMSHRFIQYNRGKRSLPLDLKSDQGVRVFRDVVRTADVVVENLRPGQMDWFGVGYEAIRAVRPGIVYCSVSGYGETGPYADRGALDTLIQAQSGLASQNASRTGGRPVLGGVYLADMVGGLYGAVSVLAALQAGDSDGTFIDLAMLDGLVSLLGHEAAEYTARGTAPPRVRASSTPQGIFETRDGHISMHIQNRSWPGFCEILGFEDWRSSGEYDELEARDEDEAVINDRVQAALVTRDSAYWLERCLAEGMLVAPVTTVDEVVADPHVRHRESIREVSDRITGSRVEPNYPAVFSGYETPETQAPRFGEHTIEILTDAGYTEGEIEELTEQGVVKTAA